MFSASLSKSSAKSSVDDRNTAQTIARNISRAGGAKLSVTSAGARSLGESAGGINTTVLLVLVVLVAIVVLALALS